MLQEHNTVSIAIAATTPSAIAEAESLSHRLHLDYLGILPETLLPPYDYLLVVTPEFLGLQKTNAKWAPFYIDFLSPKLLYRTERAGLKKEMIGRAMGLHPKEHPVIIDATAGLGRDSFILATLGFKMILLERSPILHALLNDALERLQKTPKGRTLSERLQLIEADAIHWLSSLPSANFPDVIYLDPMFPERKKSASVKKEMVILQDLLGKDDDAKALFAAALTCAKRRIVVKRPRLAPTIVDRSPHFSITGKSSRFDIYLM